MKEPVVKFETAKLAKENGFCIETEDAFDFKIYQPSNLYFENIKEIKNQKQYSNSCYERFMRPTQSLLQKWFRDEHKIFINIKHIVFNQKFGYSITGLYQDGEYGVLKSYDWTKFETYEETLENALVESFQYIKKNNN